MSDTKDFVIENDVLKKYEGNGGDVVIPEGVTCIGRYAFNGCKDLTSVIIPEGVTSIGDRAFYKCHNLTSITIPYSLTSIVGKWSDQAFEGCINLKEVHIDSLEAWSTMDKNKWDDTPLRYGAVLYCCGEPILNLVVPDGVTSIGEKAFWKCSSLISVTISASVTSIGKSAFDDCSALTSVLIPESVTSIGDRVFSGCSRLKSVTIPETVKSIGDSAFSYCISLKSVTIPESVSEIGISAFEGCSGLTSIIIPAGVTSIEEEAFSYCSGLKSINIPESVTIIGKNAFRCCSNLTSLMIPEGAISIGYQAFFDCSSLTNIMIPESVTSIGENAFHGCSNLTSVTITEGDAWLAMDKSDWKATPEKYTLYCNGKMIDSITIPDDMASIGDNAFKGCYGLKSVTISEGVKSIGQNAFSGCGLTSVTIPFSVNEIHFNALQGRELKQVTFKGIVPGFSVEWFGGKDYVPELIFPEDAFATNEKLPAEYCKTRIQFSEKEIAWLMLYQKGTTWKNMLRKAIEGKEKTVFDYMFARFADDKKASAAVVCEYVNTYVNKLSPEQIKNTMELLEKRNYEGIDALREIPEVAAALSGETIEEHPIEVRVRELCQKHPLLKEAKDVVKKGIPYTGSKQLSSQEAVAFILSEYGREWQRCAGEVYFERYGSTAEGLPDGRRIALHSEADEIAEALDQSAFVAFLESLSDGFRYRPWLLAWARYANDDSVNRMTSSYKTDIKGKAREFYKAYSMRESLLINETQAAMQFFDRIGELHRYAKMHGMTAMECRDSMMLPTFDFDADGVKRYDIGGNTIEVSIAPDLSFRLFDVNKQKDIRSFPKKSDDPAKAEACAKECAAFKKEVLAFAKERTELLHKMHMSGEYVGAELWRKVYVEHPVIAKLAKLVVWQDEAGKTFMITDDGIIDSKSSTYAPQEKARVAHVLDMGPADITAWQQWLAKHGCMQLFEQVWEPVILWNKDGIATRYTGAILNNEERNAVKRALKLRGVDMRAAEMDREYNHRAGEWVFSNEGTMLFGNCLRLDYKVDEDTKAITFGKASARVSPGNREMNAVLLEMDKATLSAQITRDNDAALTDQALSVFSAAQITGLLNLAIDHKATRCTARLLDYKNTHFPEFAEVNEFSLDW